MDGHGEVVHLGLLAGIGGDAADNAAVNSGGAECGFGGGDGTVGDWGVAEGGCIGAQHGDGARGECVGKTVGVKIDQHGMLLHVFLYDTPNGGICQRGRGKEKANLQFVHKKTFGNSCEKGNIMI